ncbi:12 kDa FK506-binding protein [Eurytemora carolleeae]|uniref:12 kDa FK506-binding protein n=1 Tax=Eurytemora carolleeae TaxID=1294199 RepID=UPI000C775BB3|nr:12 kDa FK506-binding protein [Eurytemora carolleeae]|eukprot:XP_023324519.1 12 kDa FK506-binding protein-like [Eurytemora affinis]
MFKFFSFLAICAVTVVNSKGPFQQLSAPKSPQDPTCTWYTLYEDLPEGTAEVITYGAPEASVYLVLSLNGDGKTYPAPGSRVTAHYSLYLPDCTFIESSRDEGEPLTFTIGVGEVIQGWDVGLMTMSLGQRASLVLSSDMGYGENGAGGGVIPPNSALIFDVEIIKIE